MGRVLARAGLRDLRRAAALVGRGPRGLLGLDLGATSASRAATTRCWRRARCPARSGSRAPGSTTPSTRSAARRTPWRSSQAARTRDDAEWTWGELRSAGGADRGRAARARVEKRGDRVAAYMPNIPEAIAAFLASASMGAVWSSCSPDFGARSVIDRFEQIEPKVLLAVDGYRYNGKDFDRSESRRRHPWRGRRAIVTLGYLDGSGWQDGFDAATSRAEVRARPLRPPAVGPLFLGHDRAAEGDRPGPGRDPARAPEEAAPARRRAGGDRIFWFTTTGWMMWNFLVGGLLTEAAIVLYDGSPGHPDMGGCGTSPSRRDHDVRHQRRSSPRA